MKRGESRPVDLPHDFMIESKRDPANPTRRDGAYYPRRDRMVREEIHGPGGVAGQEYPKPVIRKHIVFTGSLQGVGFRHRARHTAELYGCTGWVRDEYD